MLYPFDSLSLLCSFLRCLDKPLLKEYILPQWWHVDAVLHVRFLLLKRLGFGGIESGLVLTNLRGVLGITCFFALLTGCLPLIAGGLKYGSQSGLVSEVKDGLVG